MPRPLPYSQIELDNLIVMWPTATIEELRSEFPNRTQCALRQKAKSLGLPIEFNRCKRGDLRPFLDDSLEAWYWLGFFLADGHITKTGQFIVAVSSKDNDHLEKLAKFLKTEVKSPYENGAVSRITIMDKEVCNLISAKLGVAQRKSWSCPDLKCFLDLEYHKLAALFVGLFDGDGSVSRSGADITRRKAGINEPNTGSGIIQCHRNWAPFYEFLVSKGFAQSLRYAKKEKYVTVTVPVSVRKMLSTVPVPKLERKWHVR
jgi:hypothetical protein